MLNIVLFGPPGAGKGTQAQNLIDKFGLIHLSTGDILRAERAAGSILGIQANDYISKGELVPDEVVIGMVKNKIGEHLDSPGFIFDGFPRTIAQGEALDSMLLEFNTRISMMIALEVDEEELTRRLLERGRTSGRADDQNEETIRNRFRVYQNETSPLMEFYEEKGCFFPIHGVGSVEDIFDNMVRTITSNSE